MNRRASCLCAAGTILTIGLQPAYAAPDWSKVPARKIAVFYPGATTIEWVMKASEHSGVKGLRKGETCAGCHEDELADIGKKIVSGEKLEPKPIKGKAGSIPVEIQAAYDAANLYLRFTFKEPPGGSEKMDKDNQVKLAVMLEENKIDLARQVGCWQACHQDARTMPNAVDDKKTKYVAGGSLASGKFYDLLQWKSGNGQKPADGYVADRREMEGGKALTEATGEKKGDTWVISFTRKLAGGEGDVALAEGKVVNFGFAIHDDYTSGRFHDVSLGYTLGLGAKADVTAVKQ